MSEPVSLSTHAQPTTAAAIDDRLDVLCIGETLVDFLAVERSESLAEAQQFRRSLGGSPANIALRVALLGGRAAVVSKVGVGAFGTYCRDALRLHDVNTEYLVMDPEVHTTVVFISRTPGTPDFEAFRAGDAELRPEEVPDAALARARTLHASTFALSREPCRSAVLSAFTRAEQSGVLLSLDPNYHPTIWRNRDEAQAVLRELYPHVSVTKPSLDDAARLFGSGRTPEAYLDAFHALGAQRVILTMGASGVWRSDAAGRAFLPTPAGEIQNATGAGDTFWAAFLLALLDRQNLTACILFAQQVARRVLLGETVTFTAAQRQHYYAEVQR